MFADNTPAHGLSTTLFQTDELVVLCTRSHPLARHKRVNFKSCLAHDFVGLNRGSSLLELTSRAAEEAGMPMRLRVQVRSFDAMCHMIAANLGIGVAPLAACRGQVEALGLKAIRLEDAWATRRLLMAPRSNGEMSAAAALLMSHLTVSEPPRLPADQPAPARRKRATAPGV